jgi:lamin tail-like protein
MRSFSLWSLSFGLLAVACPSETEKVTPPVCDPGEEIFCRCRGGAAGTKLCLDDGESFGPCLQVGGECTEVPDPASGGAGPGPGPGPGAGGRDAGQGGAPPACAHPICDSGAALDPACDPCAGAICADAVDPFCCDTAQGSWDSMCIGEVESLCGVTCGGGGSGGTGGGGGGPSCYALTELLPGDIVITEIMNNPLAVPDNVGEWFEVYNTAPKCIDLDGVVVSSGNDLDHTVGASIVVQPGGYAVLGRSTNLAINGNVPVDYGYGSAFFLANGDDTLALSTPGASGIVLDDTTYDGVLLDPDGASRSLDPGCLDAICNDTEAAFCEATSLIAGSSDRGTPAQPNDPCP